MEVFWLISLLLAGLFIGLPLPFSLLIASIVSLVSIGFLPLTVIPQRLVAGIDSFAFMAIPFFILVGGVMNAGGITQRLVDFANSLVGFITGGLALVNVMTSMLFGSISGSATADTSAVGSVMIPAMKREKYDPAFTVALTACSSCAGPIIPPSITLILYGIIANVSIAQLFLAGYVPGLMLCVGLMGVTYIIAKKRGYPIHERSSLAKLAASFRRAIWALALPVILMGGILSGIFTVTEAAGVAVVYALFVAIVVHRELHLRDLPRILFEASIRIGALMTVAAAALAFAWMLSYLQIPQALANHILALTDNVLLILLMLNILFLLVGMIMEAKSAMLILLPVLIPILPDFGIDPIHFGVIVVFNLLLGLVTPPVGLCLNLAAKIGDVPLNQAFVAALPFLGVMLVVLMIITYVPEVVMWAPRLLR
jgi:C4-dicarboxylate transporter, DctM subunit